MIKEAIEQRQKNARNEINSLKFCFKTQMNRLKTIKPSDEVNNTYEFLDFVMKIKIMSVILKNTILNLNEQKKTNANNISINVVYDAFFESPLIDYELIIFAERHLRNFINRTTDISTIIKIKAKSLNIDLNKIPFV
jgi:hypothetical protein